MEAIVSAGYEVTDQSRIMPPSPFSGGGGFVSVSWKEEIFDVSETEVLLLTSPTQ